MARNRVNKRKAQFSVSTPMLLVSALILFGVAMTTFLLNTRANSAAIVSLADRKQSCTNGGGKIVPTAKGSNKQNFQACEMSLGDTYNPDNYLLAVKGYEDKYFGGNVAAYLMALGKHNTVETCFFMKAVDIEAMVDVQTFGVMSSGRQNDVKVTTDNYNKYCFTNRFDPNVGLDNAQIKAVSDGTVQLVSITLSGSFEDDPEPPNLNAQVCPSLDVANNIDARFVCGGVEQLYIINAEPNANIYIGEPINRSYQADAKGGLVVDNLEPGSTLTVWIGTAEKSDLDKDPAYRVTILSAEGNTNESAQTSLEEDTITETDGYIQVRDGTLLSYHVQFPEGGCSAAKPCDTLLTYSGYTPGLPPVNVEKYPFDMFVPEGYAVIGVNMRGTACSGGRFKLFEKAVQTDGYDVIEALAAQSWTDNIGMVGNSWPGISQLFTATTQPPSLSMIAAGATLTDFYSDIMYPGGIPNTGFGEVWLAARDGVNKYPDSGLGDLLNDRIAVDPICEFNQRLRDQNENLVDNFNARPTYDKFWEDLNVDLSKITTPTLMTIAWQDLKTASNGADQFDKLAGPKRLIGVNGNHDTYFNGDIRKEVIRFVNTYMRGSAQDITAYQNEDPILIMLERDYATSAARTSFTMKSFQEAGDGVRYSFGSELSADSGNANQSSFTYKSSKAVLQFDHSEGRATFTSKPLNKDTILAGSGSVDLWIKTNSKDVDLRATISEVRPDGKEMYIQKGRLRASNRAINESLSTPRIPIHENYATARRDITPGEPTQMRVKLFPFAHAFRAGSQIRITIDSVPGPGPSFFWMFDAVPGSFDVSILHDNEHRSSAVLPVLQNRDASAVLQGLPLAGCEEVFFQPCR